MGLIKADLFHCDAAQTYLYSPSPSSVDVFPVLASLKERDAAPRHLSMHQAYPIIFLENTVRNCPRRLEDETGHSYDCPCVACISRLDAPNGLNPHIIIRGRRKDGTPAGEIRCLAFSL